MAEENPAFTKIIHILTPQDLTPEEPAGEIVRADGSRQPVSANLMAAIEHLLAATGVGQSAMVRPLDPKQWLVAAAGLTDMGEKRLRELVADGRLSTTPSEVGDIVELKDVVALNNEFRQMQDDILQEMFEDTFAYRDKESGEERDE